jgi:hypothetical protein
MLGVTLKRLTELWEKNPRITLTELVTMCESDAQNVKRWMKSAGFAKVVDNDKKCRFVRRVDIKRITHTPPEGLTEAQRTQFYIHLGYDSYSICVHQNVLLSTVEERREAFNKSQPEPGCASSGFAKATPDRSLALPDRQLTLNSSAPDKGEAHWEAPVIVKVADIPQAIEDVVFEDGQHKNNYPERGDKPPQHISEITQAIFFPNGIPTCFPCKREVIYGTIVTKWNDGADKYGAHADLIKMAKVKGKESYISVPCYPKVILPMEIPEYFYNAFVEFFNCPNTGYEEIDRQRNMEQFLKWIMEYLYEWRLNWLLRKLLERRKERAKKAADKSNQFSFGDDNNQSFD